MPFGLKNPPAIIQSVIEEVLISVSGVCRNYTDDVVIFSKSWEDHLRDVGSVLDYWIRRG